MMISDQERLWRERSREKQPVYYEYPKEGYDLVTLRKHDEIELVQLNDYARRRKMYYVWGGYELEFVTLSRKEADEAYDQALADYKEGVQTCVDCDSVYESTQKAI